MTLWQMNSQRRDDDGYDDIHAFVKIYALSCENLFTTFGALSMPTDTQDEGMLFIITHFIKLLLLDVINHAFIVLRIHNVVDNVHA